VLTACAAIVTAAAAAGTRVAAAETKAARSCATDAQAPWMRGAGSCDRRKAADFEDAAQEDGRETRRYEAMTFGNPDRVWRPALFAWLGISQALSCCIRRWACFGFEGNVFPNAWLRAAAATLL
jgi:hypothetical protein